MILIKEVENKIKFIKFLILFFLLCTFFSCFNLTKNLNNDVVKIKDKNDSLINKNSFVLSIKDTKTIYKNKIFYNNIKTFVCHKAKDEMSIPIINLKTNNKLIISFDDLDGDIKDYYYSIIHCDFNWYRSDLRKSEYISGFFKNPIINFESSFNTLENYTHYSFEFPCLEMKPLISGNYIFEIYENEKIVAHKRFMVLDTKISIKANAKKATLAEFRNTKHEIDFKIIHPGLKIDNPFSQVKVSIKQNNSEIDEINNLQPLFVKKDILDYNYDDGSNTFWGGNEFRNFDIRSLRFFSEKIRDISMDSNNYNVFLFNDKKRAFNYYSILPDLNGNYFISTQESVEPKIESEYPFVFFSLPIKKIQFGDVYITGKFSDWQIKEENRMVYNNIKKKYEKKIQLKQGYYNYAYAVYDSLTNFVDIQHIEGSHYQTKNDYFIYVYYKQINDSYDQLIGFLKISSKELF